MEKKTDFKALSNKAKIQYIWDYYKWPILIGIAVVILLINVIIHFATYKESALNVTMVNCFDSSDNDTASFDEFFEQEGFDSNKECISFSNSLTLPADASSAMDSTSYQGLTLRVTAGDEDILFSPPEIYDMYASQGCMLNLEDVLSPDELEQYADYLVYTTDSESQTSYPCGVALNHNSWLDENNYYKDECYFGILYTSKNTDTSVDFLRYILAHEE